jgi:hypothetical protein
MNMLSGGVDSRLHQFQDTTHPYTACHQVTHGQYRRKMYGAKLITLLSALRF